MHDKKSQTLLSHSRKHWHDEGLLTPRRQGTACGRAALSLKQSPTDVLSTATMAEPGCCGFDVLEFSTMTNIDDKTVIFVRQENRTRCHRRFSAGDSSI
jgi:hypothetical protein